MSNEQDTAQADVIEGSPADDTTQQTDEQQAAAPAEETEAAADAADGADGADSDDADDSDDESNDDADADDDSDDESDDDDDDDEYDESDPLVIEGDIAGDYLERLLDILDLDGDIDLDVEGSRAVVAVDGGDLAHLVGPKGQTLDALQELTRLAVTARTGNRSRLMLDIDGYRAAQRVALTDLARTAIEEVLSTGSDNRLRPMNPFERKVVHDVVAATDGVVSGSTGEEPNRRVVIRPAS